MILTDKEKAERKTLLRDFHDKENALILSIGNNPDEELRDLFLDWQTTRSLLNDSAGKEWTAQLEDRVLDIKVPEKSQDKISQNTKIYDFLQVASLSDKAYEIVKKIALSVDPKTPASFLRDENNLRQVKGCGLITAQEIIEEYNRLFNPK